MKIEISELSREHPIVEAAYAMVQAHSDHEMMVGACEEVLALFPMLSPEQVMVLWIAVNAKNRVMQGDE